MPIIHRDVKSPNVLILEEKRPEVDNSGRFKFCFGSKTSVIRAKVGDCGASRRLTTGQTMTMTRVGSPLWTSPEILAGRGYSTYVDVYSYGVVLFEMMTQNVSELWSVIRSATCEISLDCLASPPTSPHPISPLQLPFYKVPKKKLTMPFFDKVGAGIERLELDDEEEELLNEPELVSLFRKCTRFEPHSRPSMPDVVKQLKEIIEAKHATQVRDEQAVARLIHCMSVKRMNVEK